VYVGVEVVNVKVLCLFWCVGEVVALLVRVRE